MQKTYTKYPNRKLYNREESVYTTLRELVEDVQLGFTPTVVCSRTKRDVTAEVLTQALIARGGQLPRFGVPDLISFIRQNASAPSA